MKKRSFLAILIMSLMVGLSFAAMAAQPVLAQCTNALGAPVACPGEKKKRPTPTTNPAVVNPLANPAVLVKSTETGLPGNTTCNPDAAQLQSLCAALPGFGGNTNAGGGAGPQDPAASHEGAQPHMFTGFELAGGVAGGLLGGLLIGLLLPAIRNAFTGGTRSGFGGNGAGGGEANSEGKVFAKMTDQGLPQIEDQGFAKFEGQGSAKFEGPGSPTSKI